MLEIVNDRKIKFCFFVLKVFGKNVRIFYLPFLTVLISYFTLNPSQVEYTLLGNNCLYNLFLLNNINFLD